MNPCGRSIIGFEPLMDGFKKSGFMTESGLKAGASSEWYESKKQNRFRFTYKMLFHES